MDEISIRCPWKVDDIFGRTDSWRLINKESEKWLKLTARVDKDEYINNKKQKQKKEERIVSLNEFHNATTRKEMSRPEWPKAAWLSFDFQM